jgi:hypothetical protein
MTSAQARRKSKVTIVAAALIVALLPSAVALGQNTLVPKSAGTMPKISVAFSKAAIKALLTIERANNKELVDAAMIDLAGAGATRAELSVVWDIQLFEAIYGVHEAVRQSSLAAERAMADADPGHAPTDLGASEAHDEDHACIVAWLPRLRALSARTPKQCPHRNSE